MSQEPADANLPDFTAQEEIGKPQRNLYCFLSDLIRRLYPRRNNTDSSWKTHAMEYRILRTIL
jgi:hypothetical protein